MIFKWSAATLAKRRFRSLGETLDRMELFPHDAHSNTRPFCLGNSWCVISINCVRPQRVHFGLVEDCFRVGFGRIRCLEIFDGGLKDFLLIKFDWWVVFSDVFVCCWDDVWTSSLLFFWSIKFEWISRNSDGYVYINENK
jgi:hypothetical protein